MANRIIKESTFTSDKIASLTDFEFRLWVGLLTFVDDAGRGDARPAIIKGRIFALRERVTIKDITDALHGLAAKGCVSLYKVDGKPYLLFPTWGEHQRIRDVKTKYPAPDDDGKKDGLKNSAADCGRLPQIAADCGYNPNPNPNPNPNHNISCAEPETVSTPPVITLTLNTGEEYPVDQSYVDDMQALYPNVDIMQQLRSMKAWLMNNPTRRKTAKGIRAFINSWISKEQDKGSRQNFEKSKKRLSQPSGELGNAELEAIKKLISDTGC